MNGFRGLCFVLALAAAAAADSKRKPNIIFVLTDDQDVRLGSMQAMPIMRNVMSQGANMSNFFVHTPICCQSRAALLSGRYTHNVKSSFRGKGCMFMNTSRVENPAFWEGSFIRALHQQHGYTTGLFGKVLNDMSDYGCDNEHFADGIDRSFIMCGINFYNGKWTNFTTKDGQRTGNLFKTGEAPEDYSTTVLGNASLNWIREVVANGPKHKPFFAFLGPHAPHLPSTPPPYAVDPTLDDIPAPKDPMYGLQQTDKHAFFPEEPKINKADATAIETEHTNRLKSLVAVDDVVGQIEAYLRSVGEWENTFVFYTSDHGYNLGQFRVDSHKTQVYDHNTRVPMIIRGPGIEAGADMPLVTSMVDLGPTILELAAGGASAVPATMDGMSFAPMLLGTGEGRPWKDTALIEYRSIRHTNTVSLCEELPLMAEEVDEYVSAYGYAAGTHLDEAGRPERCVATGLRGVKPNVHYHDGPNNTFAALRIINSEQDLLYSEFVDGTNRRAWDFAEDQVNFRELYNVTEDYHMTKNIYHSAPAELKKSLSARLQAAVTCRGNADCLKHLGQQGDGAVRVATV